MIYNLLLIYISFVGMLIAYGLLKVKLTSPLSLHVSSWFIVLIVSGFIHDDFESLKNVGFYGFLLWYLIVFMMLSVGELILRGKVPNVLYDDNFRFTYLKYWLIAIPACIITGYEIYLVGTSGPVNFILNLRLANIEDNYPGYSFLYMPILYPLVMSIFLILCVLKSSTLNKLSVFFWTALYCLGTMSKFSVLIPIIAFMVIREHYYGIKKKNIIMIAPLFLVLMLGLHFVRMADNDETTLVNVIGTYIYSPLVALGDIISEVSQNEPSGAYTFRFLYAVMYKLGITSIEPVKVILDYVYVPSPTNVYTALQPFYQDFSYFGIISGAVLYGGFFSLLYGAVRNGSIYCLMIYSVFATSIFTSFLTETLVTNFAGNIKLAIFLYLIWWLTVKCTKKKLIS